MLPRSVGVFRWPRFAQRPTSHNGALGSSLSTRQPTPNRATFRDAGANEPRAIPPHGTPSSAAASMLLPAAGRQRLPMRRRDRHRRCRDNEPTGPFHPATSRVKVSPLGRACLPQGTHDPRRRYVRRCRVPGLVAWSGAGRWEPGRSTMTTSPAAVAELGAVDEFITRLRCLTGEQLTIMARESHDARATVAGDIEWWRATADVVPRPSPIPPVASSRGGVAAGNRSCAGRPRGGRASPRPSRPRRPRRRRRRSSVGGRRSGRCVYHLRPGMAGGGPHDVAADPAQHHRRLNRPQTRPAPVYPSHGRAGPGRPEPRRTGCTSPA